MHLANNSSRKASLAAGIGATLPDIPMALGAAWLWTRRKSFSRSDFDNEVCGRSLFRGPDAALHSAIPIAAALALEKIAATRGDDPAIRLRAKESIPAGVVSAFLFGWAGHVFADFLTHCEDARPILWPVSVWKFESPVSYREEGRHGKLFTIVEHSAVAAVLILATAKRNAWKR